MSMSKQELIITESEKNMVEFGVDILELQDKEITNSLRNALRLPTSKKYIKTRPAKGGGVWKYVPTAFVIERLNLLFDYQWDFTIISKAKEGDEIIVEGRLSVVFPNGRTVTKTNVGNKEVAYRRMATGEKSTEGKLLTKSTNVPLSIGNDFKAAVSDCLKKCATMFGIGLDMYLDEIQQDRTMEAQQKRALRTANPHKANEEKSAELKAKAKLMLGQEAL